MLPKGSLTAARHPRAAGEFACCFGHHGGRGFVARGHRTQTVFCVERVEQSQETLARHHEDMPRALGEEVIDDDLSARAHRPISVRFPRRRPKPACEARVIHNGYLMRGAATGSYFFRAKRVRRIREVRGWLIGRPAIPWMRTIWQRSPKSP